MKNVLVILGAPFVVPCPVFLIGGLENKRFSQDNLLLFSFCQQLLYFIFKNRLRNLFLKKCLLM